MVNVFHKRVRILASARARSLAVGGGHFNELRADRPVHFGLLRQHPAQGFGIHTTHDAGQQAQEPTVREVQLVDGSVTGTDGILKALQGT
jgi:hypothetical protein